jgi:thiol:disulfide interchange protein DsbA
MIKIVQRAAIALFISAAIGAGAHAAENYEVVSPPQPTLGGGKIEVLEFFWYGCPHCYRFHPVLEEWRKSLPDDVVFRPVAAVINSSWSNHARAYFAAEALGVVDQLHDALFDALHKQKRRIIKLDDLADFAAEQGIDRQKFLDTMTSFAVETKLRRSQQMERSYKINGVPTMTIAGKYVTSGSLAGSHENVIKVMNQLIEKERAAN